MNIPIGLAAALSALTLAAHVFGGGPEIHAPVQASELSEYLKAILAVIWHTVTIILTVNSLFLAFAALRDKHRVALVSLVSTQYVLWGILFVYYGLTRLGELSTMPQWIAFFLIPALALFGLVGERNK